MKHIKHRLIFPVLILLFIGISACEKTATNVDLPEVQPLLVATSFLSPQSDSTVLFLSWSVPIFHNSNLSHKIEQDADVYIINQGVEHKMHYNNDQNMYLLDKSELSIEAGKKYQLKVVSDKSKPLTSETTIPYKPIFESKFVKIDSIIQDQGGYSSREYIVYVDLKITNPEPKAYYRISAYSIAVDNSIKYQINYYIDGGANRTIYGDFNQTLRMYPHLYTDSGLKIKNIYMIVEKVDETFYRYNHALENYSDIDVFTEPTQVYSNIENGLGVFCSHNIVIDTLDVK